VFEALDIFRAHSDAGCEYVDGMTRFRCVKNHLGAEFVLPRFGESCESNLYVPGDIMQAAKISLPGHDPIDWSILGDDRALRAVVTRLLASYGRSDF
jgi:hypothetical protein